MKIDEIIKSIYIVKGATCICISEYVLSVRKGHERMVSHKYGSQTKCFVYNGPVKNSMHVEILSQSQTLPHGFSSILVLVSNKSFVNLGKTIVDDSGLRRLRTKGMSENIYIHTNTIQPRHGESLIPFSHFNIFM